MSDAIREALAEHLFTMFANPPAEWSEASDGRKDLWRKYADWTLAVIANASEVTR